MLARADLIQLCACNASLPAGVLCSACLAFAKSAQFSHAISECDLAETQGEGLQSLNTLLKLAILMWMITEYRKPSSRAISPEAETFQDPHSKTQNPKLSKPNPQTASCTVIPQHCKATRIVEPSEERQPPYLYFQPYLTDPDPSV